ncbi:MAG: FKBP-type peptidyl-prolyl cis-trans isomerase FkpA/FKBP-type peptidyl-prolyl cis-trans isomerase FklB [Candidatus Electronema aureum]|uniref:Peptidyl-prolyl cis-trans isomerase n=1 Tax=Candidatus Electronema aureum TaxID=2005002 RepID=A0A521G2U4_9BACT|nr:MAG: FKBP-type peptidyl-prolyl cis-trans isomerase FkpA/FKBP-type peptidyl-prolyl cis-trans isomerase FklB [Candidatus Electronema aureum]
MKKLAAYAVLGLMLAGGSAVAAVDKLETEGQRFSYALGMDFGSYLKGLGENFDLTIIEQGLKDAYTPGSKPLMTVEEAAKAQQNFGKRQQEKFMSMLKANKEAAKKFLEENKSKEGIKTTASGLQYKVVKEGSGPKPSNSDTVKVHYRGTLLDGKEFDSSHKRGEPVRFRVDQVIPGWTEGLQLMNAGSVFELYLSPELAYGDRGAAPVIQPGSLLKFEVELLEIVKEEPKKVEEEKAEEKPVEAQEPKVEKQ